MKTALKIAYVGTNFYGSQAQPGLPTVESELRKALEEAGAIKLGTKIAMAGRTDAGVHALGQVVAFEQADPKLTAPRIINSKLPKDLWAYARAEVPDDFDPRRHATSREYRYILYAPDVIERRLKECSSRFLGTHDFTNFSSVEAGKYPVRTVTRLDIAKRGDFYIIDIEADSFLWNMVRKIVTALRLVGENKRPDGWIEKMFDPEYREGIPPAAPGGLYLSRVNYDGIAFEEDEYARQRAYQRMLNSFEWHHTIAEIYKEFKDAMK
ncbi:tRNA pseudouridine(38-40) synthase TruA [Methanocella arvoryzae]|uniref:tRNA pseudouridine synthase A n=1 Tax=Methanocella arvoryzae (strain DSM 22066 / NBRC 105507 / MRE50) TaxID=351160 RepID=TRUA_METAR|nr:tRNA pseudouridine(38-40) synthase TruA [Methanocella arvoryzae]Q0W2P8.1 RecName: Full=tRNA pseudouridine synthase A; AltName: Full=tRNA pseudouridine(38-40) synthase; AltName: Full=tRNA pseudouridylate synthase I; AltName: Full=tRNA-uridine isomerase I [Methanocella arvoryzae MRE50]CAJ37345.1 tRNA pseudouridine synthase [Methanocella arvoryzae MRE50]